MYTGRVESLREQVPVNAPYGRRFLERDIVPQPPGERLLDQEVFVEVFEDFRDGRARDVARDAERFDLSQRPQLSMALDVRFRSCAGQRGSAIVQGAFAQQAGDRCIDVVRLELAPLEACADLGFA